MSQTLGNVSKRIGLREVKEILLEIIVDRISRINLNILNIANQLWYCSDSGSLSHNRSSCCECMEFSIKRTNVSKFHHIVRIRPSQNLALDYVFPVVLTYILINNKVVLSEGTLDRNFRRICIELTRVGNGNA